MSDPIFKTPHPFEDCYFHYYRSSFLPLPTPVLFIPLFSPNHHKLFFFFLLVPSPPQNPSTISPNYASQNSIPYFMAFSLCKTIPFTSFSNHTTTKNGLIEPSLGFTRRTSIGILKCSLERNNSDGKKANVVSNSNYVVPIDDSLSFSNSSATITRPLAEILRDLNKKIPDTLVKPPHDPSSPTFIPW